ncbi:uncharacterized protein J4E84_001458 [Alternaria hordeiaustralica]|uniref:uncharacterized protein n=1 Tax=Alternaria hordeiaustralica TaxID=1187925 RepID=UPI0020C591A8|nr:uncharacterized protein J4E84_001458 [Alternaria hordeiaustralica]KAI4698322.1 hypothetical protein J4E84_001458 [Alternaria hordeiaustralica]
MGMEPDRVDTDRMEDDGEETAAYQQHIQTTFSGHASLQHPERTISLAFRPAYHEDGVNQVNDWLNSISSASNDPYLTAETFPVPRCPATPSMFQPDSSTPAPGCERITKEAFVLVLEQNARLRQELESANKARAKAEKTCSDLAAWTLWERDRLMRELEEARAIHRAFIQDEVDKLIAEETGRLSMDQ